MGYTTSFWGEFVLDRKLSPARAAYLRAFNESRRMKRNAAQTAKLPDPIRKAARLPVGDEGAYYVGKAGEGYWSPRTSSGAWCVPASPPARGAYEDDIVDYNDPPVGQPGLWCGWTVGEGDKTIEWDQSEKFYYYVEWLEYLIEHFLAPWGHKLNGKVRFEGEDSDDRGVIIVRDNVVWTSAITESMAAAVIAELQKPWVLSTATKEVIRDAFLQGDDDKGIALIIAAITHAPDGGSDHALADEPNESTRKEDRRNELALGGGS